MSPVLHVSEASPRRLSSDRPSSNRLQFIDVARGTAMLLVLLSHFAATYFAGYQATLPRLMMLVGMIASPTFVIINGLLLGMSVRGREGEFERLRNIFTDRALFLLTVGHLLILVSHPFYAVRFVEITDTLGLCMLVSPLVAVTVRPAMRLVLSLGLYLSSLMVVLSWHPTAHYGLVVKETFFGSASPVTYQYAFPVLPWFTLNIAASALGEYLGEHSREGNQRAMHRLLGTIAAAGVSVAAVFNLAYHVARQSGHTDALATHAVGSPFAKMPPSLVYFLFYGSIGLLLISLCLRITEDARFARLVRVLATLGQTSFALFVFQSFVYFTLVLQLHDHLPWKWAWPLYFAMSVAAVTVVGFLWHRIDGNRFLTVGYQRWARERDVFRAAHDKSFVTTTVASIAR